MAPVLGNQVIVTLQELWYSVRIWVGELPNAKVVPVRWLEFHATGQPPISPQERKAFVEIFRVVDPRIMYAAVGGSFAPRLGGDLHVHVAVSDARSGTTFLEALVPKMLDEIRVGLPGEFSQNVFAEAQAIAKSFAVESGEIRIDHAAYGAIGSSPESFRRATRVLMRLLACREGLDWLHEMHSVWQ